TARNATQTPQPPLSVCPGSLVVKTQITLKVFPFFNFLDGLLGLDFNKNFSAKPGTIKRRWDGVDATGLNLCSPATEVASRLRGKHKPEYTPHVDTGDYIVIVNAEKIQVTGNKAQDKMYYSHTGFPGGLKSINFEKLNQRAPERIIEIAVKGMLPKNP